MSTHRRRAGLLAVSAVSVTLLGLSTGCGRGEPAAPAGLHPPNQLEKAAALIRPAIVTLDVHLSGFVTDGQGNYANQGNPYTAEFGCTGFVVNPDGYVATAAHCVDTGPGGDYRADLIRMAAEEAHANRPEVTVDDFYKFGVLNWTVEGAVKGTPLDEQVSVHRGTWILGNSDGDGLPGRVVDFRSFSQGDLALLKVEAHDLPSSELSTDTDARIGDQVMAVGYPGATDKATDPSVEPTNKEGTISSIKTEASVPVYEISAALGHGMSGGPTVGLDGRVMGVNSYGITGETQAFNFIRPAAGLADMLKRNGVTPALAPVDGAFRSGLDNYYAGKYTAAIADFDHALALSPNYPQAAAYKTRAAQDRDKYGDWGQPTSSINLRWYLIGGGAAVVVLVIAMIVLVVRRRRRRRADSSDVGAPAPVVPPSPGNGSGAAQRLPTDDGLVIGGVDDRATHDQPVGAMESQGAATGAVRVSSNGAPHGEAGRLATLQLDTLHREFCGNCGSGRHADDRFCRNCGRSHT